MSGCGTPDPYVTWDKAISEGHASDGSDGWPDLAIVPLVERLRLAGIVTLQSCIGHPGSDDGHLWIDADSVPEQAIYGLDWSPFTEVTLHIHPRRFWSLAWLPHHADSALASLVPLATSDQRWSTPDTS